MREWKKAAILLIFSVIVAQALFSPSNLCEVTAFGNEGHVEVYAGKATYYVNPALIDYYGRQKLEELMNCVDERFDKIMNITK